eukprot:1146468-Pelagomonas_calceolata.AAC.8
MACHACTASSVQWGPILYMHDNAHARSEVQTQLARLPPALLPPSTRAANHNDNGRHMDGLRLMAVLLDQTNELLASPHAKAAWAEEQWAVVQRVHQGCPFLSGQEVCLQRMHRP